MLHQMSFDGNRLAVLATNTGTEEFQDQLADCQETVDSVDLDPI